MNQIFSAIKSKLTFDRYPYLTILSNVFFGLAFGKILVTPGDELPESTLIKAFLIIGTCLFFNYLWCLRRAGSGIVRDVRGKLRPFLREALVCAALNSFIFIFSIASFFFKSYLA